MSSGCDQGDRADAAWNGGCDEVLRVWGSFVILKGFGFLALVLWGCLLGGVWMRLQLVMALSSPTGYSSGFLTWLRHRQKPLPSSFVASPF